MTGPLANEFAQVREAVEFGYGGDPNYRPVYEEGIAALARIEERTHNMEKVVVAARAWADEDRCGEPTWEKLRALRAELAALSAGKGTPA